MSLYPFRTRVFGNIDIRVIIFHGALFDRSRLTRISTLVTGVILASRFTGRVHFSCTLAPRIIRSHPGLFARPGVVASIIRYSEHREL